MPAQMAVANTAIEQPKEPANYSEAITCSDSNFWIPAIFEEYDSLIQNQTWELCELPPGRQAIKGKWVLKYKPGYKDTPPRFKARFVACGYSQVSIGHSGSQRSQHDPVRHKDCVSQR